MCLFVSHLNIVLNFLKVITSLVDEVWYFCFNVCLYDYCNTQLSYIFSDFLNLFYDLPDNILSVCFLMNVFLLLIKHFNILKDMNPLTIINTYFLICLMSGSFFIKNRLEYAFKKKMKFCILLY